MMLDPESFLDSLRGKRIVLDEIHRLQNPSELLKIAADYHPRTHIVATGSSTLGASKKFRDTLAGRKRDLWLAPMCLLDMDDANQTDLKHRFLRGRLKTRGVPVNPTGWVVTRVTFFEHF
jgi:predicted AAA+ superfamily ATPase